MQLGKIILGADNKKLTVSMVLFCIVAASAGLLFGYDIGVLGGVSTMEPFLKKFFPHVMMKMGSREHNTYCVYDNHVLTLFTSSHYLAALVSSLFAGCFSASNGRKATLVVGGSIFLLGTLLTACAMDVVMLIFGRVLLGVGIGFSNQAAPVYLSEMAPPKWRGAFATGFNFFMDLGMVTATIINFFAAQLNVDWNWRLAVGLTGVPGIIMTLGALFIPDTALSLVQRGRLREARDSLSQIRGVNSAVDIELMEILNYSQRVKSKSRDDQYKKIFQREYRPHLVLSAAMMVFQQLTGVGVAAFYSPIPLQAVGFGSDSALIGAVIMGLVNLASTMVCCSIVDRVGRRVLFVLGGATMFICQIALAWLLATKVGSSGDKALSKDTALAIMVFMILYAAGFGHSWGPLSFFVPSEVLPTEVRPAGNGISISINFMMTFLLAQSFLSMLCHFKFAVFLFYAGWMVIMTIFVLLFLPETKGIALEAMHPIWEKHWYWERYVERKIDIGERYR